MVFIFAFSYDKDIEKSRKPLCIKDLRDFLAEKRRLELLRRLPDLRP